MSTYGYFKQDAMSGYAISHHGIKGQKWGIRRFQNPDGSLTAEGMRRYGVYSQHKQIANKFDSMTSKMSNNKALLKDKAFMDEYKKAGADWENELKKYKDKDYRKSIKTGKKLEKSLSNSITDKVLKGESINGFTKTESRNKDYDNYSKKLSNGTTISFSKKKSDNSNNIFNYAKDFENNYSKIKKECDNSIIPVMKSHGLDNKTISKLLTKMNYATVNDDGIIYTGYDTTGLHLPFGNNSFNVDYNIIKKKVENAELGD